MANHTRSEYTLVTGGAGFIGTNLADRLLRRGESVLLLDDLSRPGVARNVKWLKSVHGARARLAQADCRDFRGVERAVQNASSVFHFAAQVAVTTSLADPLKDFETNARGTLNVLEAVRRRERPIPILFTSTNKVYGPLDDVELHRNGERVIPSDHAARQGIDEDRPLDFHSPYGCSKGAADQYVLDYARTFDLPGIVFRMSCIYGPHQCGNEDQGWVAHFLIRALSGDPITIYGDGLQVRDALFVGDLVDAFLLARDRAVELGGSVFNLGGGVENTTSLLELVHSLEDLLGVRPELTFEPGRLADQRYYVSNCRRFREATGWRPRVPLATGVDMLATWLRGGMAERAVAARAAG